MKQLVLNWIQELCPSLQKANRDLDHVYRVGMKPKQNAWRRYIIVRFASYAVKADMFHALNNIQELAFEGEKMDLFQDLTSET